MVLLCYDKGPCLCPVPAASSVHSSRVASVQRVSILTGHWLHMTLAGTMMGPDFNFSSHIISLTVRAATATSQYRYLLFAAQHQTPSIVNTNTEMKTQHNPLGKVLLDINNKST